MKFKNIKNRIVASLLIGVSSIGIPTATAFAEFSADFRGGTSTSDNVARTSGGEIDDQTAFVGTSLSYLEASSKLTADIRASLDYVSYFDDTFESQLMGGFDGQLRLYLIPERLSWIFRDSFGQRLLDPLARPNPANREDINYFSTGPTFRVPMGNRNFIGLGAQYTLVTLEDSSQFDNDRLEAQVQIGRNLSSDTTLSLNFGREEVEFDNDGLSNDYEVTDAFVRYAVLSARNDINIDVGLTELDTDDGRSGDGFLLRADWTRFVSESTTFATGAGSRYSDQGDIFEFSQDISAEIGDIVDTDGADSPFRSNYVYARYIATSPRTRLVFEARMTQDDYDIGGNRDRDLIFGNFSVTREFSPIMFGTISARASKRDYKYLNQVDDQIDLTATIGFRFSRSFDVRITYLRADRDSNVEFQGFTENRGVIQFTYTPPWARRSEVDE